MTINQRALRHITSAGIRKRQGAFSKPFCTVMSNVPYEKKIKKEDQIFCCRQCIAGYALSLGIHRIHSEINFG
jgi:hypothetical protein